MLQSLFVKRTRFLETHVKALQNFENQNDIIQMGHGNVKLLKITISNWRKFKNRRKPNGQLPTGQHIIIQGGDKPFFLCSVDDTSVPASKRSSSLKMWTHWHRIVVMARVSCAAGARSLPCYLHMCLGEIVVLTIVCVLGTESLSYNRHRKKHHVGALGIKLPADWMRIYWWRPAVLNYLLYPLCVPKLSNFWFWRWFPLCFRWVQIILLTSPVSFCYKTNAFSTILAGRHSFHSFKAAGIVFMTQPKLTKLTKLAVIVSIVLRLQA